MKTKKEWAALGFVPGAKVAIDTTGCHNGLDGIHVIDFWHKDSDRTVFLKSGYACCVEDLTLHFDEGDWIYFMGVPDHKYPDDCKPKPGEVSRFSHQTGVLIYTLEGGYNLGSRFRHATKSEIPQVYVKAEYLKEFKISDKPNQIAIDPLKFYAGVHPISKQSTSVTGSGTFTTSKVDFPSDTIVIKSRRKGMTYDSMEKALAREIAQKHKEPKFEWEGFKLESISEALMREFKPFATDTLQEAFQKYQDEYNLIQHKISIELNKNKNESKSTKKGTIIKIQRPTRSIRRGNIERRSGLQGKTVRIAVASGHLRNRETVGEVQGRFSSSKKDLSIKSWFNFEQS